MLSALDKSIAGVRKLVILSTDRVNFDVTRFLVSGKVERKNTKLEPLIYHRHVELDEHVYNVIECHVKFVSKNL